LRLAILYLLQNPVRAGLVANSSEYPWSSAGEYMGKAKLPIIVTKSCVPKLGKARMKNLTPILVSTIGLFPMPIFCRR
jgi:hypothetical protein